MELLRRSGSIFRVQRQSAEDFGGKKSGKGNRQGFLSRSITRRSGRIAKKSYNSPFCNSESSLAKKARRDFFDKLGMELLRRSGSIF